MTGNLHPSARCSGNCTPTVCSSIPWTDRGPKNLSDPHQQRNSNESVAFSGDSGVKCVEPVRFHPSGRLSHDLRMV